MKKSVTRHFPRALVAWALFAVLLLCIVAIGLIARTGPNPATVCREQCATRGMTGVLVYRHGPEQTAGMRSRGPQDCACR